MKSLIQHYSDCYPEAKYPKLNINYSSNALFATLKGIISLADPKEREPLLAAGSSPEVKRIEYSPKPTFSKPFASIDDAALQQIQNGSLSVQPFGVDRPPAEFPAGDRLENRKTV